MHVDDRVTERTVERAGLTLLVREAGAGDGFPVVVHHGTPMAGLLHRPWIDDAEERGIRLVAYDRPGYGGSSPHPGRSVADAAPDVAAIADALGIERFATWGLSGGGPHALACAALLPDRVTAAASVSGVGEYAADDLDFLVGMGEDNVTEFTAATRGRAELEPLLQGWAAEILKASPENVMAVVESVVSEVDKRALTGEFAEFLHDCNHVGLDGGLDGWIDDDIAFTRPWGFDLGAIEVPVSVWQGRHDLMVPFAHGEWLVAHVRGAVAKLSPELGHLTIPNERIGDVHAWLLDAGR